MKNWIIKYNKNYLTIDKNLIKSPKTPAKLFEFIKNIWINSIDDFSLNLQRAGLKRTKKKYKYRWLFVLKGKKDILKIEIYLHDIPHSFWEIKK